MAQDNLFLQGAGWTLRTFTRSNTATQIIILYVVFSIFAIPMGAVDLWKNVSLGTFVIFLFLWVFIPSRLSSEEHTYQMKKLELGSKENRLLEAEEGIIYQPQALSEPKKQITHKSRVVVTAKKP